MCLKSYVSLHRKRWIIFLKQRTQCLDALSVWVYSWPKWICLENNCFDILPSIYRSIYFFNIYQITVISIAIQNIWTNENSCQQTLKQLSQLFYCFGDGDWQWDFVKMYLQVQQVAWLRTKGSPVSLSVCAVHPRCADLQTWARWVLGAYP